MSKLQTIVDRAQNAIEDAIQQMEKLERESCRAAGGHPTDSDAYALCSCANSDFTASLGHLKLAKATATRGCVEMPGVQPNFGGK